MKEFQEKLKEWGKIIKLLFVRYALSDLKSICKIIFYIIILCLVSEIIGLVFLNILFCLIGRNNTFYEAMQYKGAKLWLSYVIGLGLFYGTYPLIKILKSRIEEIKKEL